MVKPSSFGICELCGVRKGKTAMMAHLRQCLPASAGGRPAKPALLLRVQPGRDPVFWLTVASGREARLGHLDGLLRKEWLECCDHMSEFYTAGRRNVSMNSRMAQVFASIGDRLNYVYDFGSSTELVISFAGLAEGTSEKPVVIARNEPPVWPCDVCKLPAASICSDCGYSGAGFFCTQHAKEHECGEDMLLPVVDSPRMGVCGYTGSA